MTSPAQIHIYYRIMESPVGPLLLTSDGEHLTGVYFDAPGCPVPAGSWIVDEGLASSILVRTAQQLGEYFAGKRTQFDVPLSARGTDFQRRVWAELARIPYGTTISYGELARRIGNAKAMRAVGLANGQNPHSIIVPCHRVIGASGKLTGYGGGLPRKTYLLQLESGLPLTV